MNIKDEDILDAARNIRPHLPELIPPEEARAMDAELALHLNEGQGGKQSANAVMAILRKRQPTQQWLADFLKQDDVTGLTRGYQPPPGDPVPVSAPKYVCPLGDYTWYRVSAGSAIPNCPTHGVTLVAAA